MKRLQSTRLRSAEPHRPSKKWVTTGEAYFEKAIRDRRYNELVMDSDLRNVRKRFVTDINPATKRLALAFVVEWEEWKEPEKPESVN